MKHLIVACACMAALTVSQLASPIEPGVPIVASPVTPQTPVPAAALPAHAKRIGAVHFNLTALQPESSIAHKQAGAPAPDGEAAWLAPRLYLQLFPDVGFDANGLRIEQDDFGIDGCPRINRWSDPSQSYLGYPLGLTSFPIGTTSYSNDMMRTLTAHDTVDIVAAYRTPTGMTLPGAPGTPQHHDCENMTFINWSAASGTVGWYESQFDSNSAFSSPFGGYKGPWVAFSTHLLSPQWFRVRGCNAAGCGAWSSTHIPATGPNCEPV